MIVPLFRQHVYPDNINRQIHGLRGLSAFIVFVFHIYGIADEWHFWPAGLTELEFFFRMGRHGVEIFFIISGYLITASLLRHQNAGRFLVDRAIRIYPVFLTIQLLVFALGPIVGYRWFAGIGVGAWITAFFSNLLFLPGIFSLPLAQPSAWSLSYEAAFYLISTGLYMIARRGGAFAAGAVGCLIVAPLILRYPNAAFFLVGVVAYFLRRRITDNVPSVVRRSSSLAFIAALVLQTIGENFPAIDILATLPALLFFVSIVNGRCALSKFLRRDFFQYMGTISYSFYLWFGVVTYPIKLLIVKFLLGRFDMIWLVALFAVTAFIASVLVSQASNVLLEVRLGRWLRSLARRRSAAALPGTAA